MEFYFKVGLTVLAGLLILHTITANLMVIIAFRINKQLHTLSNYCLVSLAVSDMIVGILLMSVFTIYLFIGYWPLGAFFCDLWLSLDYGVCTASILNLLVIAVDRLLSVSRPLTYRRTPTKMGLMIAAAWVVSGLIWAPWIFAWPYIDGVRIVPENECFIQVLVTNPVMATVLSCCSFFIPVIVTTTVYSILYKKTQQRTRKKKAFQSTLIASDARLDKAPLHNSKKIPTTEAGVILSLIKAVCCCFFCQNKTERDFIDDNYGIVSQSHDSGIACCCEKDLQKESPSTEPRSFTDVTCVSGVDMFKDITGQTTNKSNTDESSVDANVEADKLPYNASIGDFDSIGMELENTTSMQDDFNSQDQAMYARVRTIRAKRRQQQYNDRKMLTILSATLLSLTISFAPYYTTAIIESFFPGFLDVVAANICKYAFLLFTSFLYLFTFMHSYNYTTIDVLFTDNYGFGKQTKY